MIIGFNSVSTIYSDTFKGSQSASSNGATGLSSIVGIRDFSLIAEDARAVLDSQYQDALKNGTQITFDGSKTGVPLNLSSLSDRAIAAIALNEGGLFSDLEVAQAGGTLAGKLQVVLAPSFKASSLGDARPVLREYLNLFDQLEPEVKRVLGMTDAHRAEVSGVLAQKNLELGKTPVESFRGLLQLLQQMTAEWREDHPDGYNRRGETYYVPEKGSRSFTF